MYDEYLVSHGQCYVMRKPDFGYARTKAADQLCSYCTEVSSSVAAKAGLCQTWSETPKPVFSRRGLFLKFIRSDFVSRCCFIIFQSKQIRAYLRSD